jgi:hypothetical protein
MSVKQILGNLFHFYFLVCLFVCLCVCVCVFGVLFVCVLSNLCCIYFVLAL